MLERTTLSLSVVEVGESTSRERRNRKERLRQYLGSCCLENCGSSLSASPMTSFLATTSVQTASRCYDM